MTSVAWSYSVLNSFETCAWRHYLTKVSKEVVEPQTDALKHGNQVHKAFEYRVKEKRSFPVEMPAQYEAIVQKLEKAAVGGSLVAEQQMALDASYKPTKWFSKGSAAPAWVRAITDVHIMRGDKMAIFDYKTGRRDPESAQLRLSAAVAFAVNPHVQQIKNGFIWLKTGEYDGETFTRADVPAIWQSFLPRVNRLEIAHEQSKWPKKPSGLCKKWCPVPHSRCEHRS